MSPPPQNFSSSSEFTDVEHGRQQTSNPDEKSTIPAWMRPSSLFKRSKVHPAATDAVEAEISHSPTGSPERLHLSSNASSPPGSSSKERNASAASPTTAAPESSTNTARGECIALIKNIFASVFLHCAGVWSLLCKLTTLLFDSLLTRVQGVWKGFLAEAQDVREGMAHRQEGSAFLEFLIYGQVVCLWLGPITLLYFLVTYPMSSAVRWLDEVLFGWNVLADVIFILDGLIKRMASIVPFFVCCKPEWSTVFLFFGALPFDLFRLHGMWKIGFKLLNLCRIARLFGQRRFHNPFFGTKKKIGKLGAVLFLVSLWLLYGHWMIFVHLGIAARSECSWMMRDKYVDESLASQFERAAYYTFSMQVPHLQKSEDEGTCKVYLWIAHIYMQLGYGAALLGFVLTWPLFMYIVKRARDSQATRESAVDIIINQLEP